MKSFQVLIPLLILLASECRTNDDVIFRHYVWRNFHDFVDYGWTEETREFTKTYKTPADMDPKLSGLNSTDEVWGFKKQENLGSSSWYALNLGKDPRPEFCGIINATVSLKYYMEGNSGNSYIMPVIPEFNYHLSNSLFSTWSQVTREIEFSDDERPNRRILTIYLDLEETGLFLIDEVQLSFAARHGDNCQLSCDHDCEYRAVDCLNYYTCFQRRYKDFRNCGIAAGMAFNPSTKTCDLIENVNGCYQPPPATNCVCEYKPHENDCSRYYYCPDTCHLEQCEERQCPSGLNWSVDAMRDGSGQQQCIFPDVAVCFNGTQIK